MSNRCNSCEVMMIQGVRCHEQGCPEIWKDSPRECRECGSEFEPESSLQEFCGDSCRAWYWGLEVPEAEEVGEEALV